MSLITEMDDRSRAVFRRLVETYLETGDPVGSQKLSRDDAIGASSATVRNVLANLTEMGLLQAPHISAGRLPTEHGLRLFVDGMLQVGELSPAERQAIEPVARDENIDQLLQRAAARLSGLTQSASLVMTNVHEAPLRQIEFVSAGPGKAVVITVGEDGHVENRIIDVPADLPPSSFVEAANYLNARLRGQNLAQARANILAETEAKQADLDALTSDLVQRGIAKITDGEDWSLIVRGQGHLLNETAVEDLERVRQLFDDLERKRDVVDLLTAAQQGDGVKIFIGSENQLFSLSGSSVIAAPYRDEKRNIVGVLAVIGPTRTNYAKIVPMVDYSAEMLTRMLK